MSGNHGNSLAIGQKLNTEAFILKALSNSWQKVGRPTAVGIHAPESELWTEPTRTVSLHHSWREIWSESLNHYDPTIQCPSGVAVKDGKLGCSPGL
jgi:hypothetical protein